MSALPALESREHVEHGKRPYLILRLGRYASLSQSKPKLLEAWRIRNSSILFLDDCITSGTTARLCYEALVAMGNHVDGLIWVSAGG